LVQRILEKFYERHFEHSFEFCCWKWIAAFHNVQWWRYLMCGVQFRKWLCQIFSQLCITKLLKLANFWQLFKKYNVDLFRQSAQMYTKSALAFYTLVCTWSLVLQLVCLCYFNKLNKASCGMCMPGCLVQLVGWLHHPCDKIIPIIYSIFIACQNQFNTFTICQ